MTQLDAILDHKPRQLSIDELLAEVGAEEKADPLTCEVEAVCHAMLGVNGNYRCGWLATDVNWCTKRKRLIGGEK